MQPPKAIQRFLDGLETGDWAGFEQHLTPDARHDAAVPGRRYVKTGPEAIIEELRREWTGSHTWHAAWQNVTGSADVVVVELEAVGRCPGGADHEPHEEWIRLANVFVLEDGRIAEHRYYCPGEYDDHALHHEVEASIRIGG